MKGFVIKYQEKDSSEIKGFHALYENEQEARESSDRKGWKVLSIEPEVAQRVPYNPDNCNFAYRPQWFGPFDTFQSGGTRVLLGASQ